MRLSWDKGPGHEATNCCGERHPQLNYRGG